MRFPRSSSALTALLLAACGPALAQEPLDASSSGSPAPGTHAVFSPGSSRSFVAPAYGAIDCFLTSEPAPSGVFIAGRPATRLETVRYQPRFRPAQEAPAQQQSPARPAARRHATGHLQLHGGFLERNGDGPTSFALGMRGGPSVGDVVQLGIGVDWYHESESEREVVGTTTQGGRPVTTTSVLARTNADLIPIQAHLQIGGGGRVGLGPYFGVAGGYQYLLLQADDYDTGSSFDATYGGWGWQMWGGLALRLSSNARLFAEVFANTGNVERDVEDPATGNTYREGTDTDGSGLRFGLNFGI